MELPKGFPKPEEFPALFKKNNLTPRRRTWGIESLDGQFCTCGLGCLLREREGPDFDLGTACSLDAEEILGLDPGFVDGFMSGWDGSSICPNDIEEVQLGYETGAAAAAACDL